MSVPVDVVIPHHNQHQWAKAAAQSAAVQASNVFAYDDYSQPPITFDEINPLSIDAPCNTNEEVSFYLTNHLHNSIPFRSGVCFARNYLIKMAADECILPLDADDTLYPNSLERLYAAWQPGTWVYGNHTEVDEAGNVIREVEAPPPGMLRQKNLTYATFLFHKDDWQRAGGYDPDFELGAEDYAFQVALTANGVRPVKLGGAPVYKRMLHPNGRTSRAIDYFPMLYDLIRHKWPSVFPPNSS